MLVSGECDGEDASMEPSSVEDGNFPQISSLNIAGEASMEPSSVEDGNQHKHGSRMEYK